MPVRIETNDIVVPGQLTLQSPPSFGNSSAAANVIGSLKAFITGLDLNAAAPADLISIPVPFSKYLPVRVIVYNPTANLSVATMGLYDAPAGGGNQIVAPVALANLTGTGTLQSLTVAALAVPITSQLVYPRLTVAAGVPGTASMVVEFIELGFI